MAFSLRCRCDLLKVPNVVARPIYFTLVSEVFLDFSLHERAAKRRTRAPSGEKEKVFFLAASRPSCSPLCGGFLMRRKIKKNLLDPSIDIFVKDKIECIIPVRLSMRASILAIFRTFFKFCQLS